MLSIVSYAMHYAQRDLEEPALEFPGERANTFADYMYFSIAVATTFGATDVNITTPRMRHVVNLNTLLTFVYNTVIVASRVLPDPLTPRASTQLNNGSSKSCRPRPIGPSQRSPHCQVDIEGMTSMTGGAPRKPTVGL